MLLSNINFSNDKKMSVDQAVGDYVRPAYCPVLKDTQQIGKFREDCPEDFATQFHFSQSLKCIVFLRYYSWFCEKHIKAKNRQQECLCNSSLPIFNRPKKIKMLFL